MSAPPIDHRDSVEPRPGALEAPARAGWARPSLAEPVPDAIPERCYIPAADPSFVAFGESLVRLLVAEAGASAGPVGRAVGATPVADPSAAPRGEPAQRAWFERQLRRRFPYASVEPALVRPGRTARGAWRVYRDGGPSQSLW